MTSSVQRRGYAEAIPDKIKLSLALPHQVRLKSCISLTSGPLALGGLCDDSRGAEADSCLVHLQIR